MIIFTQDPNAHQRIFAKLRAATGERILAVGRLMDKLLGLVVLPFEFIFYKTKK